MDIPATSWPKLGNQICETVNNAVDVNPIMISASPSLQNLGSVMNLFNMQILLITDSIGFAFWK